MTIVLLNACFSEPQAQAISCHNIYAIGSSDELSSTAARVFAANFYKHYAKTNDVKFAVKKGLNQATAEDDDIDDLINLYFKGQSITI